MTLRLARPVTMVNISRTRWRGDDAALSGSHRGSRAGRSRQNRLRRVLPKAPTEFGRTPLLAHGAAFHRIPLAARARPAGQGARPKEPGAVPRLRHTRSRSCVDQVGEVSRLIPFGIAEKGRADTDPPEAPPRQARHRTNAIAGSTVPLGINSSSGLRGAGPEGCSSDPFKFQ